MSRYSDLFIAKVRDANPIDEVMKEHGVKLRGTGHSATCKCPFHDDNSPSMSVDINKGVFHCHTNDCVSGNVFNFVMESAGLTFPEAVKDLADRANLVLEFENGSGPDKQQTDRNDSLQQMVENAAEYYNERLLKCEDSEAINMLQGRGIASETIDRFKIGTASSNWRDLCNTAGGFKRKQLLSDSGLAVFHKGTGGERDKLYDRFRDGIIFPVRDEYGKYVTLGRRSVIKNPDGKWKGGKYINGPETDIFHKSHTCYGLFEVREAAREKRTSLDEILVVEGYTDVTSLHQHGIPKAVAAMGTALTHDHVRKLLRFTNHITFCFDGDKAGRQAGRRALEKALPYASHDKTFSFVFMPAGEDPDSYLKSFGREKFEELLKSGITASQMLATTAQAGRALNSVENRSGFCADYIQLMNLVQEGPYKDQLLLQLDKMSGQKPKPILPVSIGINEHLQSVDPQRVEQTIRTMLSKQLGCSDQHIAVRLHPVSFRFNDQSHRSFHVPPLTGKENKDVLTQRANRLMSTTTNNSNIGKVDLGDGLQVSDLLRDRNSDNTSLRILAVRELRNYTEQSETLPMTLATLSTEVNDVLETFRRLAAGTGPDWQSKATEQLQNWGVGVEQNLQQWQSLIGHHSDPAVRNELSNTLEKILSAVQLPQQLGSNQTPSPMPTK